MCMLSSRRSVIYQRDLTALAKLTRSAFDQQIGSVSDSVCIAEEDVEVAGERGLLDAEGSVIKPEKYGGFHVVARERRKGIGRR